MAKKRSAKKPPAFDRGILDAVIALLVKGFRPERIAELLAAEGRLPLAAAGPYLGEARRLVTLAADYDRDEELGRAIRRFHEIYAAATAGKEHRCAIDAQRELCRLMRLYEDPEAAGLATDSGAERELEAVRAYLTPLNLAGPDTPTDELARLAVERILCPPA